jgi:uncharacterized membrane protein
LATLRVIRAGGKGRRKSQASPDSFEFNKSREVRRMFYEFWWIFPVIMIVLCFLMMRGRSGSMMCGFGPCDDSRFTQGSDSAMDILDKRYARGEIDQREYEEKKAKLIQTKRGA